MVEPAEALERRIDELRTAVREAVMAGDRTRAKALRAELRQAEQAWEEALSELAEAAPAPEAAAAPEATPALTFPVGRKDAGRLLPIREQVHHALTLLTVPAAPKLVVAVHDAFFAGEILGARLTSLRRDEERSFRAAPYSRPYYLCAALTADLLSPARGLLAVSTWPMPRRIVGPLSPRCVFLIAAIRIAEHIERLPATGAAADRLLRRFAVSIPGAANGFDAMKPREVARAAEAELRVHEDADRAHREAAAVRAGEQLDDVQRLFGANLRVVGREVS